VEAHQGPDDVPKELVDAESRALEALAAVPCTSDEEFHSKLRYLLSVQKGAYGPSWAGSYAKEILEALALHLLPPDETGEQSAPSKAAEKPKEPLTLPLIADRLDPAVRMSRALEFAVRGAGLDEETTAALTEMAMRLQDELESLHIEVEGQLADDRECKQ
jgi:outer membrane protein OmpA-like peptidoglycan-associated protein